MATDGEFIERIKFLERHEKLWNMFIHLLSVWLQVRLMFHSNERKFSSACRVYITSHFSSQQLICFSFVKEMRKSGKKCSLGKIKCKTSERKLSTAHATWLGVWLITLNLARWRKKCASAWRPKMTRKKWIFIWTNCYCCNFSREKLVK